MVALYSTHLSPTLRIISIFISMFDYDSLVFIYLWAPHLCNFNCLTNHSNHQFLLLHFSTALSSSMLSLHIFTVTKPSLNGSSNLPRHDPLCPRLTSLISYHFPKIDIFMMCTRTLVSFSSLPRYALDLSIFITPNVTS